MKLRLRIADPAGNITLFILNPVPEEVRVAVASALLARPEFQAEQVAFQVPAQLGGDGRIQMMGGEFCGNATRAYGYLLSSQLPGRPETVRVEVSGAPRPLTVTVNHREGTSQTQMPLPLGLARVPFRGRDYDAVRFEGIVHLIVPGKAEGGDFVAELLAAARNTLDSNAYGILFVDGDAMTPAVYVRQTDSLVWEGSCGSGSLAVAVHRALARGEGEYRCALHQPGGSIEAEAVVEGGRVIHCAMGGPVSLSEELELELELPPV